MTENPTISCFRGRSLSSCPSGIPSDEYFDSLYVLERSADTAIRIEPVLGHEAISLIQAHTYRAFLVRRLGQDGAHLRQCERIAQRARVFRFQRPWDLKRLEAGLAPLLQHLRQGAD